MNNNKIESLLQEISFTRISGSEEEKKAANIIKREIENLGKFVLSRTNIPEDVFYENFATDWYLDANEALKYGLCEKIVKSLDEII